MHAMGIHSAMAIKRQRRRRDEQRKARERRLSTQSSDSCETFHSPYSSVRHKYHNAPGTAKSSSGMRDGQVVTSIGMLHIGIVFIVFGLFLIGAGIIPDQSMSWSVFNASTAWWNEVTATGLFSLVLGFFLLILNCVISRKEEEDLEDYVQRQLTRSRSGHRLERDVETGILTTRHTRKAVALQQNGANGIATDVALVHNLTSDNIANGTIVDRNRLINSADILLESIIEEGNSFRHDRSPGISPIEIENDKKQLLRRESINDEINITRI